MVVWSLTVTFTASNPMYENTKTLLFEADELISAKITVRGDFDLSVFDPILPDGKIVTLWVRAYDLAGNEATFSYTSSFGVRPKLKGKAKAAEIAVSF